MAVTNGDRGEIVYSTGTAIYSEDYVRHTEIRSIEKVNNGFIAQVGCQKFVFTSMKELLKAIDMFFTDYEKAKKTYYNEN